MWEGGGDRAELGRRECDRCLLSSWGSARSLPRLGALLGLSLPCPPQLPVPIPGPSQASLEGRERPRPDGVSARTKLANTICRCTADFLQLGR